MLNIRQSDVQVDMTIAQPAAFVNMKCLSINVKDSLLMMFSWQADTPLPVRCAAEFIGAFLPFFTVGGALRDIDGFFAVGNHEKQTDCLRVLRWDKVVSVTA